MCSHLILITVLWDKNCTLLHVSDEETVAGGVKSVSWDHRSDGSQLTQSCKMALTGNGGFGDILRKRWHDFWEGPIRLLFRKQTEEKREQQQGAPGGYCGNAHGERRWWAGGTAGCPDRADRAWEERKWVKGNPSFSGLVMEWWVVTNQDGSHCFRFDKIQGNRNSARTDLDYEVN